MTIPWTKILGVLILAALAAALVAGCWSGYEHWRGLVRAEGYTDGAQSKQHEWDDDKIIRDKATLDAVQAARADERNKAAAVAKGERDAREKAEQAAVVARRDHELAAAAGRGLLDTITGLNAAASAAGIPDAASCPSELVRERAASVRARNMLGACSAEYTNLVGRVDESWNGLTLKLDVALGYVKAVAPQN